LTRPVSSSACLWAVGPQARACVRECVCVCGCASLPFCLFERPPAHPFIRPSVLSSVRTCPSLSPLAQAPRAMLRAVTCHRRGASAHGKGRGAPSPHPLAPRYPPPPRPPASRPPPQAGITGCRPRVDTICRQKPKGWSLPWHAIVPAAAGGPIPLPSVLFHNGTSKFNADLYTELSSLF